MCPKLVHLAARTEASIRLLKGPLWECVFPLCEEFRLRDTMNGVFPFFSDKKEVRSEVTIYKHFFLLSRDRCDFPPICSRLGERGEGLCLRCFVCGALYALPVILNAALET